MCPNLSHHRSSSQTTTQLEQGGRAVRIPEGIRHVFVSVPEDDMQPKVGR